MGAGVSGLLTALECALAGHRVTVLDRGPIPNPAAGSYDQHRVMRVFVPDDPVATGQRLAAHHRWLELETLLGTAFYRRVGVLTGWPRERVAQVSAQAAAAGVPLREAEPAQLAQLELPAGVVGLREPVAGVLLAQRVLRAAARWLAGHGAVTLRPGCAVTGVDTERAAVVLADGERLGADLVLVAAGAWGRDLVAHPVVLHRQTMLYLWPPEQLLRWWRGAPAAGGLGADGRAWAVPPGDGTFLKISSDAVRREVADARSEAESQAPWVEQLLGAAVLAGMDRYRVAAVKACHYVTDAATGGALLTRVGPAVWSRAACGGSGFGTAPLVAREIVDALRERAA
ncbi:FAD-binding oxidoreductase [Kitasatospora nipponensis]|uniref:NAD(P)/FAD-dependent oxidoreductase n=1 Tax=Kitasatospora nipponensis TaxID=258049 RepID=UPI0031E11F74